MSVLGKSKIQLEAHGITKKIQQKLILNNVSLQLREKECLGIFGDPKSGRSTFIQILSGLLKPDIGELFILDRNADLSNTFIKRTVGVVLNGEEFDEDHSPYVNIVAYGCSFGLTRSESRKRASRIFRELNIENTKFKPLNLLEIIEIKKLSLCRALVIQPQILVMDDIKKGLNPTEGHDLENTILKLLKNDISVIYSTSELSETENLCDRILIIENGNILISGKPNEIIKEHIGPEVIELKMKSADVHYYTERIQNQYEYLTLGDELRLFLKNGQSHMEIIKNISSEKILIRKPNLYDVYLKLVNAKDERSIK